MRNGFLGSAAALMLVAGLVHGQMPYPPPYGGAAGYYYPAAYTPYYWPTAYPFYPPYAPPQPSNTPEPPPQPPQMFYPRAGEPVLPRSSTTSRSSPVGQTSPDSGPSEDTGPPLVGPPPVAGVSVFNRTHGSNFFRGFDVAPEQRYDVWLGLEYLYWWTRPMPTSVPLVTTGSATDPIPGALGQPNTKVIVGGGDTSFVGSNGGRLTMGAWFDKGHNFGMEFSGFYLENVTTTFVPTNGVLTVPVLIPAGTGSLVPPGENAVPIINSFPQTNPLNLGSNNLNAPPTSGPYAGSLSLALTTRLWGLELNGVANLFRSRGLTVDLLGGVRYMNLQESLSLNASSTDLVLAVTDSWSDIFQANNQFFGGQLGVRANAQYGPFFLGATLKAALGANYESLTIGGTTTQSVGGVTSTFPGGILTQPTNIGTQTQTTFSVVPEFQFKVGVEFIPNVRLFAGYDFLYWTNVARPGNQIDHTVNPTQSFGGTLVGPANPAVMFNQSNYFIQGLNVGMEIRF